MRNARAWLLATLIAATAFACGDDDDDGAQPDAAGDIDAAATIDADTTPDATPPDAMIPPGEVTLTLLQDTTPLEGVDIVFSNADGTLISHMLTDSAGQATETVPYHAMITVLNAEVAGVGPSNYFSYTLATVLPGDSITLDVVNIGGGDGGTPGLDGTVTVDWPGEQTGATEYQVSDGCRDATEDAPGGGGDPPDTTAELGINCRVPGGANHHLLAQAVEAGGMGVDTLHGAAYLKDVAAGTTATLPAWSTNYEGPSVDVGNLPKGALGVFGDGTFTLDGITFDLADGGFFFGGGGTFDVLVPQGIGADSVLSQAGLFYSDGSSFDGISVITVNQAGLGTDLSHDLVNDALPGVINGMLVASNPARPSLSWTSLGDTSAADLAQIAIDWEAGKGTESHSWLVRFNPGTSGPWRLPELPAALSAFAPDATTVYDILQILYADASYVTADWDTIRAAGGAVDLTPPSLDFTSRFAFPSIEEVAPLSISDLRGLRARVRAASKQLFGR
jgi:hypothetical protein